MLCVSHHEQMAVNFAEDGFEIYGSKNGDGASWITKGKARIAIAEISSRPGWFAALAPKLALADNASVGGSAFNFAGAQSRAADDLTAHCVARAKQLCSRGLLDGACIGTIFREVGQSGKLKALVHAACGLQSPGVGLTPMQDRLIQRLVGAVMSTVEGDIVDVEVRPKELLPIYPVLRKLEGSAVTGGYDVGLSGDTCGNFESTASLGHQIFTRELAGERSNAVRRGLLGPANLVWTRSAAVDYIDSIMLSGSSIFERASTVEPKDTVASIPTKEPVDDWPNWFKWSDEMLVPF